MSIQIHPYLLARLVAAQEAFNHPGYRPVVNKKAPAPVPHIPRNNWDAVIKEAASDEDGEGGGGTMKGFRGKQSVNAKNAMRKLARK